MRLLILTLLILTIAACRQEKKVNTVVAIQPFGDFSQALTDSIQQSVEEVYGFKVVQLDPISIPEAFFINVKSPRYRADSIIRYLHSQKPDTIDFVVGLTNKDISTTKRDANGAILKPESRYTDWGVFGLGFRPGSSCIVSAFRIKSANEAKFIERLKKVCMHELGHNLGLIHCENDGMCVMRDAAETIKTVDQVNLSLCESCKKAIQF